MAAVVVRESGAELKVEIFKELQLLQFLTFLENVELQLRAVAFISVLKKLRQLDVGTLKFDSFCSVAALALERYFLRPFAK